MSLVDDRRCDGCMKIIKRHDDEWWTLIPPGWDGEDRRLDLCDVACLLKYARRASSGAKA